MGLGPCEVMKRNPRMIYARLSGYGQTGPLSNAAGHDINYLALSGILSMLGRKNEAPTPPINLLADFAGGGLLCAFGIVLGLFDRGNSGCGQVVDLSMSEGSAYVGSWLYSSKNSVLWDKPRGENWIDTGSHFYDTYKTKDGRYMAVGSIEPQFYYHLLKGLELDPNDLDHMNNFDANKEIIQKKFKEKTQDEWCKIFASLDACVSPVLTMEEAPNHPHNVARQNFFKVKGQWEPTATPRLTDAAGNLNEVMSQRQTNDPPCPVPGQHSSLILKELGYTEEEAQRIMKESGLESDSLASKL